MPVDHIRISEKAKAQLIKLKRHTGLKNWNVLCRWAFCLSLAEETRPVHERILSDSNVEMSWRTFAGVHEELYLAILQQRCVEDGLDPQAEVLAEQFRLHLHRGIGYLSADRGLRSISAFVQRAL